MPIAATRELLEALARVGLWIVDRQSCQHFGERQHGVAEQYRIEIGKPWIQRNARLGQSFGLGQDR